jgi:hypothetical protein
MRQGTLWHQIGKQFSPDSREEKWRGNLLNASRPFRQRAVASQYRLFFDDREFRIVPPLDGAQTEIVSHADSHLLWLVPKRSCQSSEVCGVSVLCTVESSKWKQDVCQYVFQVCHYLFYSSS